MKKIVIIIFPLAIAISIFIVPVVASAAANWDVTGAYTWLVLGTYAHDLVITTQNPDGTFVGIGGYPSGQSPYGNPGQTSETITGQVTGNLITFKTTYSGPYNPGYSVTVSGTIASNGTMSGTSPWEWHTTSGVARKLPYGEIISPTTNEIIWDSTNLEANYYDGDDVNDNAVSWAVRFNTCVAATDTVFGNVDGESTPYNWDGVNFNAVVDMTTSLKGVGQYCFVFNPADNGPWPTIDVRETRMFWYAKLGDVIPAVDYNPVGTDHTVSVGIDVPVSGVKVLFVVAGDNPQIFSDNTDASGVAEISYTGTNPGMDTISACVDLNDNDVCDPDEPASSVSATKYWQDEYVTGGGNIKVPVPQILTRGKSTYQVLSEVTKYTFGGNVGFVPGIEKPVGQFQIVDHSTGGVACHFNDFTSLTFSDGHATNPYSEHNTATFTASGRCNNDSTLAVTVVITDVAEPGAGADTISVTKVDSTDGPTSWFPSIPTTISGGNFQVHPPEFNMPALYEKNPSDWSIVPDGASGVLAYEPSVSTFNYYFAAQGLLADTDYSLIYYADPWPGNNPGALIGSGTSNGSGGLSLSGSVDLGMDLPHPSDGNYPTGAKIWLVLSSDYNGTSTMTGWNPTEYLFENNLIQYDDTDTP